MRSTKLFSRISVYFKILRINYDAINIFCSFNRYKAGNYIIQNHVYITFEGIPVSSAAGSKASDGITVFNGNYISHSVIQYALVRSSLIFPADLRRDPEEEF